MRIANAPVLCVSSIAGSSHLRQKGPNPRICRGASAIVDWPETVQRVWHSEFGFNRMLLIADQYDLLPSTPF